jgi:hypothetical protein
MTSFNEQMRTRLNDDSEPIHSQRPSPLFHSRMSRLFALGKIVAF